MNYFTLAHTKEVEFTEKKSVFIGVGKRVFSEDEAKKFILKEASEQGVLETAEQNAEKTLTDMFSFAGYELNIEFKE